MTNQYQQQYGTLLQQLLVGDAEPAAVRQFESAALQSPELVEWFAAELELAALLQWQHAPTAWKPPVVATDVDVEVDVDVDVDIEQVAPLSRWQRVWDELVDFANLPGTLAVTIATLSITCIVLILALISAPTGNASRQAPAPLVATLIGTTDGEWAGGAPQTDLAQGEQVELLAGLAEIRFDDGARVVLEGPALFTIASPAAGHLQRGALTAWVPRRAAGFAISTPLARVVDLGTEFAVRVTDDSSCEVHVFEGSTEVELLAQAASAAPPIRLAAGEAVRLARVDGQVEVEPSLASKVAFARRLGGTAPERPLAIGVDFQRGEEPNRGVDIEPRQLAGLVPQINWNIGQMDTRPMGTTEHPVIDSRGQIVAGLNIDWNSQWRGAISSTDTSFSGRVLGDFITSDRSAASPNEVLRITVRGLPAEYRGGGFSLICYRHASGGAAFDAENTIRIDYDADGTIDDEATLPSSASQTFRISGQPEQDFEDFHARFELPEEVERFEIIVDAPQGKLATLSGIQIVENVTAKNQSKNDN